jgi:hypothetical protein
MKNKKEDSPSQEAPAVDMGGAGPDTDTGEGYSLCDDFCPYI